MVSSREEIAQAETSGLRRGGLEARQRLPHRLKEFGRLREAHPRAFGQGREAA